MFYRFAVLQLLSLFLDEILFLFFDKLVARLAIDFVLNLERIVFPKPADESTNFVKLQEFLDSRGGAKYRKKYKKCIGVLTFE